MTAIAALAAALTPCTCGHPRSGHTPRWGCTHTTTPGHVACPCWAYQTPPPDTHQWRG